MTTGLGRRRTRRDPGALVGRDDSTGDGTMVFVPFWEDEPEAWDQVQLGRWTLPGIAEVSGKVGRRLDKASSSGSDGGSVRDKGYDLADIEITVKLYTREHLATWADFQAARRPRATRGAISVYHPALQIHDITEMVIESVTFLKRAGKSLYTSTLKGFEYHPPTPVPRPGAGASRRQAIYVADAIEVDAVAPSGFNPNRFYNPDPVAPLLIPEGPRGLLGERFYDGASAPAPRPAPPSTTPAATAPPVNLGPWGAGRH